MRMTLTVIALGALLGLGACTGKADDTADSADTDTTTYEGARVRHTSTGWRPATATPTRD